MKLTRIAATATAAAVIALTLTTTAAAAAHHTTAPHTTAPHTSAPHTSALALTADTHPAARTAKPHHTAPADHTLAWLASPGGQAQVTFNNDVATLAADLQTESHAPTTANHLAFEADARTVRTQAGTILHTPALLPHHNRTAYQRMLRDFITVANLLQPGPGYGTTPQDYTAWYTALKASDITIW
jgi:hypothetical protein